GGARRPQPAAACRARDEGGQEPARRPVRVGLRAERLVLCVGSRGPARPRHPRQVSFGASTPWSLGVEEELFLVDADTLEPVPLSAEVVPDPGPRIKHELFACVAEITTPVCEDADGVLAELRRLRADVA